MRPETGNNRSTSDRKVSIQQPLDGHSFSLPGDPGPLPDGVSVEVELLMPRTLLVPETFGSPEHAAAWFAASGMPLREDDRVVETGSLDGCRALIAVPCEVANKLLETWGDRIRYTTPLLHVPSSAQRCVWIARRGGLVYIKLYDAELEFADVLPSDDETELLYFVERLGGCFPLSDYTLCLAGEGSKSLRHLLGKRFKRIVCE